MSFRERNDVPLLSSQTEAFSSMKNQDVLKDSPHAFPEAAPLERGTRWIVAGEIDTFLRKRANILVVDMQSAHEISTFCEKWKLFPAREGRKARGPIQLSGS